LTSVTCDFLKPDVAWTVTTNKPDDTWGILKFPLSLVVVLLSLPVALFLAVTDAFGTTAPLGSVTVPTIDPVVVTWPKTGRPTTDRITNRNKNLDA
jgi:hypothetical protein